jgi:hypothetical protein
MTPTELEERSLPSSTESDTEAETPKYRITFGTFTILAPNPNQGD